jgi:hypothetical protein
MNLVNKLILVMVLIGFSSCGDPAPPLAVGTAHVYTNKTGGSVIYCPEELDPVPTEWDYNGTAEINEDDILEQCELE